MTEPTTAEQLAALLKAADGLCTGGDILSARHEDRCPRHAATAKLRLLGGPLARTVRAQHEALEAIFRRAEADSGPGDDCWVVVCTVAQMCPGHRAGAARDLSELGKAMEGK